LNRDKNKLTAAAEKAPASVDEQRGAGLDRCSPEELAAFQRLNAAYLARFGHPFIVAVKGLSRGDILAAFEARLANDPEAEFAAAIAQIHRIASFRLAALFNPESA
jgi:OHCU decarboxylase